ncbi:MAG: hypothetical protein GY730_08450 [bacterium]|nr:hypothetical protein [bacterium]
MISLRNNNNSSGKALLMLPFLTLGLCILGGAIFYLLVMQPKLTRQKGDTQDASTMRRDSKKAFPEAPVSMRDASAMRRDSKKAFPKMCVSTQKAKTMRDASAMPGEAKTMRNWQLEIITKYIARAVSRAVKKELDKTIKKEEESTYFELALNTYEKQFSNFLALLGVVVAIFIAVSGLAMWAVKDDSKKSSEIIKNDLNAYWSDQKKSFEKHRKESLETQIREMIDTEIGKRYKNNKTD